MMLLLDGSPKAKNSTSAYLLDALAARLPREREVCRQDARGPVADALVEAIAKADALVVAFPLYVDGIPSHLLRVLEALQPRLAEVPAKPRIYVIVNSGFYDARQNHIALSMLRVWAGRCGLPFGRGLAIGGGGMAQAAPIGSGPLTGIGRGMDSLARSIALGDAGEDLYAEPDFPRWLYKAMAHSGWRSQAKRNGVGVRALKARV